MCHQELSIKFKMPASDEFRDINMIVETPKNSRIVYELDHDSEILFVVKKLCTSMVYPFNYGFIPGSLQGDKGPVDILLLCEESFFPLSVVRAAPVGVLLTEEDEGNKSRIIAVPSERVDLNYSHIKQLEDIRANILDKIRHFFEHYEELEPGKLVKVVGYGNDKLARQKIEEAVNRYSARNSKAP